MSKINILIIDDDKKLCERLQEYFLQFDFKLFIAFKPSEGRIILDEKSVDLIILDGMLPEMDGIDVCREIRETSSIPIIMLTARGDELDRITGLEQGADDYISKPFSPRELIARIRSVLRREKLRLDSLSNRKHTILCSGNLTLNIETLEINLGTEKINLTGMETDILRIFMEAPGVVLSRDKIVELIHGPNWKAFDRSLDIAISRLRKKLKDCIPEGKFIRTVRGKGYVFVYKDVLS